MIINAKEKNSNVILELIEDPFFIYISCFQNISKVQNAKNFNIDFTYKVVTLNFPLLVFGFTDINRHFHLISLCLSKYENEKTVEMCISITSDFCKKQGFCLNINTVTADYGKQFPGPFSRFDKNVKILQCWFHTSQLMKKRLN